MAVSKRYEMADAMLTLLAFATWVALAGLGLMGVAALNRTGLSGPLPLVPLIFGCFGVLVGITLARAQIDTASNTARMVELLEAQAEAARR